MEILHIWRSLVQDVEICAVCPFSAVCASCVNSIQHVNVTCFASYSVSFLWYRKMQCWGYWVDVNGAWHVACRNEGIVQCLCLAPNELGGTSMHVLFWFWVVWLVVFFFFDRCGLWFTHRASIFSHGFLNSSVLSCIRASCLFPCMCSSTHTCSPAFLVLEASHMHVGDWSCICIVLARREPFSGISVLVLFFFWLAITFQRKIMDFS
jgi:hypothetical protein